MLGATVNVTFTLLAHLAQSSTPFGCLLEAEQSDGLDLTTALAFLLLFHAVFTVDESPVCARHGVATGELMPCEGDAPYRVTFKPTGSGTVFMQAFDNKDGSAAHSYHYTQDGPHPLLSVMTAREKREWKEATAQEWGE
jgi:hypothetical protein